MKVWVITFFSNSAIRCADGVYAVASSLERALTIIDQYREMYNETLIDYEEHDNSVHCVYTSKGQYNIRAVKVDTF